MESREGQRTAKVPEFLQLQTIGDMWTGESRAVQSHAVLVCSNGDAFLNPDYRVHDDLSEDHPILLYKTAEGFVVDAELAGDAGWYFNDDSEIETLEFNGKQPLPILRIIFNPSRR